MTTKPLPPLTAILREYCMNSGPRRKERSTGPYLSLDEDEPYQYLEGLRFALEALGVDCCAIAKKRLARIKRGKPRVHYVWGSMKAYFPAFYYKELLENRRYVAQQRRAGMCTPCGLPVK
jgi:hypothetical protein